MNNEVLNQMKPSKIKNPFHHKPRKLSDWFNPATKKALKLKDINQNLVELMREFNFERIDDIITLSPLHFKLNFNAFYKLMIDPSRQVIGYEAMKKMNGDKLPKAAKEIVASCKRLEKLMTALETPVEHNGASNWQGNQVTTIFEKVNQFSITCPPFILDTQLAVKTEGAQPSRRRRR